VKQPQSTACAARSPALPLDATRLEQFLDLQARLLRDGGDPGAVAERGAQAVATFLGTAGAAVALVQEGAYRLLGAYGVDPGYASRCVDAAGRDGAIARALATGRPASLPEPGGGASLLLPFRAHEAAGALHVVTAPGAVLPDDDVALARALALLVGVALANAERHRRLAQVSRLKGDALAAMAHDLRAPLNAILGYASLLGEGAFGTLQPEQREICATVERQALELVDLLGATLDVARLETGRLSVRIEEFQLGDVLTALRHGTFAQADRAGRLGVRLAPDLPPLRSDRVKVKEIVQNLIDNALKHGAGAPVEVDVAFAPDRECVRITVRDQGPGIPAEILPHLFEPFRPAGGRGTGFGLYIVRCFAEALGGRVAARSHTGEGAAITVELPLATRDTLVATRDPVAGRSDPSA
jgi:signal transduction histidine kinase